MRGKSVWVKAGAIAAATIALFFGCCAFVKCGLVPVNADVSPGSAERWIAQTVLEATVTSRAADLQNPMHADEATLATGLQLYKKTCLVCHGGADAKPSQVALGLYQKPPQFGDGSMSDDPENTTFWKIAHGIRFTGMPAFDNSLTSAQMWQITAFLHHINALPRPVQTQWRSLQ